MTSTLFINGRFLTQRQTGVQRFAQETVRAIDALLSATAYDQLRDRVVLLTPPNLPPDTPMPMLRHIVVRQDGRFKGGYRWEQIDLPRLSASGVLLNLCNLGPVIKRRQIVVVHDATPCVSPESFSRGFRLAYRLLVPVLGRAARHIMTVTNFSRQELVRWYRIPPTKITLCSEGSDHILSIASNPSILERHRLGKNEFFLAVGVGSPNKNADRTIAAFEKANLPDVRLVMTGNRDHRVHPAGRRGTSDRLCRVGHVSDGDLRALYENALALVYPSRYEGFGLPPLEAMACGCPVIISNQQALLEVASGGDAALVCDMDDDDALAALLDRLNGDENLRRDLSLKGQAHAARFRWAKTAETILDACLALTA